VRIRQFNPNIDQVRRDHRRPDATIDPAANSVLHDFIGLPLLDAGPALVRQPKAADVDPSRAARSTTSLNRGVQRAQAFNATGKRTGVSHVSINLGLCLRFSRTRGLDLCSSSGMLGRLFEFGATQGELVNGGATTG
jgi:hypothetical protein